MTLPSQPQTASQASQASDASRASQASQRSRRVALVERERGAFEVHRASLATGSLPPPSAAPRGTFLHGFLLPFSLVAAALRDPELRRSYVKVTLVRVAVVAVIALVAFSGDRSKRSRSFQHDVGPRVVVHESNAKKSAPVKVDVPGVHVDLGSKDGEDEINVLGKSIPVARVGARAADDGEAPPIGPSAPSSATAATAAPAPTSATPPSRAARALSFVAESWAWLLALVAFLSGAEAFVVFLSRRWDDWLSFHASRLAAIRPEDATPKEPKIAIDLPWLWRKAKRRVRGYVVLAAGVPMLLPLRALPTVGGALFGVALTAWGWYWLGVFTAAKSAHAWADEGTAPSPLPIRALTTRVEKGALVAPLRLYGRLWSAVTRGVNPAAASFERSRAAFLGLALARAILSLPGLYLLARPIVPVAAGRLCAESDPHDRFSLSPSSAPARAAPAASAVAA